MVLKLNNQIVKNPTDFKINRFKLTKANRLASGKMTMDVIAIKLKFQFKYEVISGTNLDILTEILFNTDSFYTLGYQENGVEKTASVYVGAIDYTRFRTDGVWYWKDVTFDLIEQ